MNEKRFRVIQNSGNLLSETLKDPKPLFIIVSTQRVMDMVRDENSCKLDT